MPPTEIGELRDLVRRRTHLVAYRDLISNRIHRRLESSNVKLASVPGKVTGHSAPSSMGWQPPHGFLEALARTQTGAKQA